VRPGEDGDVLTGPWVVSIGELSPQTREVAIQRGEVSFVPDGRPALRRAGQETRAEAVSGEGRRIESPRATPNLS
jgi:hypothetical protein